MQRIYNTEKQRIGWFRHLTRKEPAKRSLCLKLEWVTEPKEDQEADKSTIS